MAAIGLLAAFPAAARSDPLALTSVPPVIADAVARTVESGTVDLDYGIVFAGNSQIPDGASITGDGQTNFATPREMRIRMDLSDLGSGTFEVIIDAEALYITGDVVASIVPEGTWLVVPHDSAHPLAAVLEGIASGSNDASLLLYFLLGATEEPTEVGTEELGGTTTTRLTVPVDLALAQELAPDEVRDTIAANIAELEGQGVEPVLAADAWITEDGHVKQVQYVYTLSEAMGGGTMTASVEFSDYGAPLELDIPDPADTVTLEELELDDLTSPAP
jgi:hypothetical protein